MHDHRLYIFQCVAALKLPVVKPIRAFSPPSNPAVHHSFMGPIDFVGTPPKDMDYVNHIQAPSNAFDILLNL